MNNDNIRKKIFKKKEKNFLLVYPTMVTEAPMTLAMLGAVLKQEGFNVSTQVNLFSRPLKVEDFVKKAKEVRADYVGISMITFKVLFVYEIAMALREAGFIVIIGGAHPTVCAEEAAQYCDIVVRGEGEQTLREIVQGKDLNEILSITTKAKGNTPSRARLDINKLPVPDLEVFDKELFCDENGFYKGFHRIYTSRGCPAYCTFCDWQVFKQTFKEYDIRAMVDDILMRHEKYGIDTFSIADDCFTVNRDRVYEFCELIKPHNLTWKSNSRASLVTLDLLKTLKNSGCHSIAYGLESGDSATLKRINKKVTLEENINACRWAFEAGLECYGCLMTGFPFETEENVRNTVDFVYKVWDYVSLFQVSGSLMPFPGSPIYKTNKKKFNFENFWLEPEYQECGIQLYQNAGNPYKVSELYQRLLFDDTYIQKEKFFSYTDEYKAAVRELVVAIGKHNLEFMYKGEHLKQRVLLGLSRLSIWGFDKFPGLERNIVGGLFSGRSKIEILRDKRRGISKSYTRSKLN
jgi:anaerobic magnesium-protoporphyrin IX monomethyl ester cyclase